MRHQKSGRKFSRPSAHRNAMFSNMLASLVMHERIETTEPKAKELRSLADKTISWGKSVADVTSKPRDKRTAADKQRIVHAIRQARRVLRSDEAIDKLFSDVGARFTGRPGGYTRLLKTRTRRGDAAPMAFLELTVMAEKQVAAPEPVEAEAAEGGEPATKKAAKAKAPKAEAAGAAPAKKAKAPKAEAAEGAAKPAKAKKPKKDE
jgi:large subunit ribosomal protein L17